MTHSSYSAIPTNTLAVSLGGYPCDPRYMYRDQSAGQRATEVHGTNFTVNTCKIWFHIEFLKKYIRSYLFHPLQSTNVLPSRMHTCAFSKPKVPFQYFRISDGMFLSIKYGHLYYNLSTWCWRIQGSTISPYSTHVSNWDCGTGLLISVLLTGMGHCDDLVPQQTQYPMWGSHRPVKYYILVK